MREQLQATLGTAYTIERELGGGGMSRVFVAQETALRRKVVVKVLPAELLAGVSVERFNREILLAAQLQHPHIVPVLSAGDSAGVPFYTMPFVEGESLRARIARAPLPVAEVVSILRDVARALAYAHERGIVHRDIKPDNVLLTGGSATVTDFGIAKAISASRTSETAREGIEALTQAGMSIGTPAYMAPEQAAGDPQTDHRADIYAFGCLAYELLTGVPPFERRTPQALLAAHMAETARPITERRGDVPPSLEKLVTGALAKDPAARPQSATELLRLLDSASSGEAAPTAPPILLGGTSSFWRAITLCVAAFIGVGALAKIAITAIGLPDWVFPGALVAMALGFPIVLWTGYVQRVARQAMTATPTITPGGTETVATHGTLATLALKQAPRTSFSRAARMAGLVLGAFALVVATFMTMRAYNIGPAKTLFGSGTLKEKDVIVMTDFTAQGGDASLGRVVAYAVREAVAQSRVLELMDPELVARTLEMMNRPKDARIDLATSREIAQRRGGKAIIDGEVTTLGTGYVLTVRLVSADSGRVLATIQRAGDGPNGLIEAADKVARALREKAGESLRAVQNTVPLWTARTGSLEALRLFTEGVYAHQIVIDWPLAIEKYKAAVALDSNFAEGWRRLGIVYRNMGAPQSKAFDALDHAYRLRDRLSPWERDVVEGSYYMSGPGRDRERAVQAFLKVPGWSTNVALLYRFRRELTRSESTYRALLTKDTGFALGVGALAGTLRLLGKTNDEDSLFAAAIPRFPQNQLFRFGHLWQSYYRGDFDRFERSLDSARQTARGQLAATVVRAQTSIALLRGRTARWRELQGDDARAGAAIGRSEAAILELASRAAVETGTLGRSSISAASIDSTLARAPLSALSPVDRPYLQVATDLAWAGHTRQAKALLGEYDRVTASDTARRRAESADRSTARAALALAERRYAESVALFRKGDSLPDGPANECIACLPLYLGRTFDAANIPDSAITHFERYLALPVSARANYRLDPANLAPIHERLGQLYEAKGDVPKAVEHDRAFIKLWEKADPELQPRVATARARLEKLTPVEGRPR